MGAKVGRVIFKGGGPDFFPNFISSFKDSNAPPTFAAFDCGHHPSCSCAYNKYVVNRAGPSFVNLISDHKSIERKEKALVRNFIRMTTRRVFLNFDCQERVQNRSFIAINVK